MSMERYNPLFPKKLKEAEDKKDDKKKADIPSMIKTVINTKWSKSEDKGKNLALFKGLLFSDDPKAKKFVSDLDDLTDKMNTSDYDA